MKKTAQGYLAMVDGYNRIVIDFNTGAEEKLKKLEAKLSRYHNELPNDYIERYYEKFGKYPKTKYFRYSSPKLDRTPSGRLITIVKKESSN